MDFPERIFFVTTVAAQRRLFFSCERAAKIFLDTHSLCIARLKPGASTVT
jgi:hypothetical protein